MRHHLTPVRMVNTKITMAERVWRKGSPPTLLLGMKVASGTVENSMEDPQKTKSRITLYSSNPTPGHIYAQNHTPKKTCIPIFITALFTIAKHGNNVMSTDR